jgi:hypothetical protein
LATKQLLCLNDPLLHVGYFCSGYTSVADANPMSVQSCAKHGKGKSSSIKQRIRKVSVFQLLAKMQAKKKTVNNV